MEQREAIEEEIAEIDDKVTELLQEEERLIEEGSWLKRNFVKLRKLVTLKKNVDQAVVRLRPKKKDDKGGDTASTGIQRGVMRARGGCVCVCVCVCMCMCVCVCV